MSEEQAERGTAREQRVALAARGWSSQLARLGGDHALVWSRDQGFRTLDLTHAHPSGLAMLLAGRTTRLSALAREPAAHAAARGRARALAAKTVELAEEQGIAAGWLAVGVATWDRPDDGSPQSAPVLLRACSLLPRGASSEDFDVDLGPDTRLNPVLVEHLAAEYDVHLDADAIAALAVGRDRFDPAPALQQVVQDARVVPGFSIDARLVVGTFSAAPPAMVADLQAQAGSMAAHDVVAALGGDPEALAAVGARAAPRALPDPAGSALALDADSSQAAVVEAVLAGSHLVVQAPPGTGSSQTIANLVAALAGAGKRTLLVAPKRAAIDAVVQRLTSVGLHDLVLAVDDGAADLHRAARELARTAEPLTPADVEQPSNALRERDDRLTAHTRALHEVRLPWAVTAYDAQSALADLTARRPAPRSRVRVRGTSLQRLDRAALSRLGEQLRAAAALGALGAGPDDDPWFGARLETADEARQALATVTELVGKLPAARQRMVTLMAEAGMAPARTVAAWGQTLELVAAVRQSLEVFSPTVFDSSLTDVVAATAPRRWRRERAVSMGQLHRRRLRASARSMLRPGTPPRNLHAALVAAHEQRERWQEAVGRGSRPALPSGLDDAERAYLDVAQPLAWLSARFTETAAGGDLANLDLDVLVGRLQQLSERTSSLPLVPHTVELRDRLRAAGLEPLLADLAQRAVPAGEVGAELELVWWTSVLEHVAAGDPAYGAHDGGGLREAAVEFADLDRQHLARVADRVRTVTRSGAGVMPCWAMSPLVVPQLLPPGELFDVVVVAEASQVSSAEAIAAISRGRQVVLVGDRHQPRPKSVIVTPNDEPEPEPEPAQGSVLDALSPVLPVAQLCWHYRSYDERLMAVAKQHIYGEGLVTFPAAAGADVLTLVEVDGSALLVPGAEAVESTDTEVARVVDLVIEHARRWPTQSLGVVTLGRLHANRIEEALRRELADHPDVAGFFVPAADERFFVKDVERVQGDVRDAVILSIGYGRTPHGRVLHRFGLISQVGGEGRLAVATTRARRRMTVVSSFGAHDLDPARLTSPGALMLRDLLAAAAAGGRLPAAAGVQGRAERDPLFDDLAVRLRAEGLTVRARYGASTGPIDLAVGGDDGRLVVAVEGDGPAYAGLASTRERDRLRVEQLQRRGWTHLRVWSTDVFRDPAREVARVRAAVLAARRTGRTLAPLGAVDPWRKPEQSADDTDAGWGEVATADRARQDREQWLMAERPPHWD